MSMTEKKKHLVPRLRFPEFRNAGPWEVKRLGEVASEIIEKVGDKKLVTVSITAGKGFVTQEEKFGRNISGRQYKNYILLKKGQFAYNRGNSKTFPQGAIYQLREFDEVAVPNAFYSFEFRTEYIPEFFIGYFENNFHGKQLARFITSSARSDGLLNVSANDFFSILLPIPRDREEQQKIADCLSSLDEVIELQAKKLEALKAHKRGLMQQLFPREGETTPRLRFPEFRNAGPWEVKRLGAALDYEQPGPFIVRTEQYSESGTPVLTAGKTFILGYTHEAIGIYVKVPVIIFDDFTTESKFVDFPFKVKSSAIKILSARPGYSLKFMHEAMSLIKFDAFQHKRYWIAEFQHLQIPVPSLAEQQKIADCLSSLDEVIELEARKLEALKAHKKGLMQQLFPQEVTP
jgi:type I restriction enzyme S subunit